MYIKWDYFLKTGRLSYFSCVNDYDRNRRFAVFQILQIFANVTNFLLFYEAQQQACWWERAADDICCNMNTGNNLVLRIKLEKFKCNYKWIKIRIVFFLYIHIFIYTLFMCFYCTCPLFLKCHCKPSVMNHFYPNGRGLTQDDSAPILRAQGSQNDLMRMNMMYTSRTTMLQPSESPELKLYRNHHHLQHHHLQHHLREHRSATVQ